MESANRSPLNLKELKLQMEKQVGPAPARLYFSYLNGLLSKRLSKSEFDRLCILTLGPHNLFLHNQLIRSVFQNACQHRAGRPDPSLAPVPPARCTAAVLPVRQNGGNASVLPVRQNGGSASVLPVRQNGELRVAHLKHLVKRQRVGERTTPVPVPLLAQRPMPLSVMLRPLFRKVPSSRSFSRADFLATNEELKRRLDDIARENGLEGGATSECAQLLNIGLDSYLRQVIGSCLDLVQSQDRKINNMTNGSLSIQDFKVAMELNPQQLGSNYPLLLEKLSCVWFHAKD